MTSEPQPPTRASVPWWGRRGPHTAALEFAFFVMLGRKLVGWDGSWWLVFAPVWGWLAILPVLVVASRRGS